MKLHTIAFVLLVIGGLNWLLTAFGYGIARYIPGNVAMIIYILIGLSAIYEAATHRSNCKHCMPDKMATM
jgi:uncharacterized membrane protein YuzA (DUF378 family)